MSQEFRGIFRGLVRVDGPKPGEREEQINGLVLCDL